MPKLDLLTQDYNSKSIDQNQSRLINMYLEPDTSKGKYQIVAYPMPGLTTFSDTNQSNIRAMLEYNSVLYVVAGNKFGSVASNGTFTQLGSNLSTSSGFAKILAITGGNDTNNQIMILDGTNGYTYNIDTSTATFPITDTDFPQTAIDATAQDDYVLVAKSDSISYQISNLADTTSWAALDFASKIRKPDNIVAIRAHQSRIYILGNRTTEIWWNSGNADFPFERIGDTFIHTGCAAKQSVVMAAESLFMLSQNINGGYSFVRFINYVPSPIETTPIAYQLNNMTTVSDCIGYGYVVDGHEMIDWVFPTDAVTLTYDVTTGVWVTKESYISSAYTRFLGNCSAFCYNKRLVGDYNSGKIYTMSTSVYQENSVDIRKRFTSPPVYFEGKRVYVHRLQIDVETGIGSSKTFDLEVSNDSGRTWETIQTFTVPSDNTTQLYTSSLGSAFNWMFRLTSTMNARFVILGFQVEVSIGTN